MAAPRFFGGALLLLLCAAAAPAAGADPAKFFEDNCAMCHAIGGPPGGAPDLKDVTQRRDRTWLLRFVLNPEEVAKTDPAAAALVKQYDDVVMPATEGVTADDIEAVLRYIEAQSGAAPAAAPPAAAPERTATAADIAAGREWYEGRRTLAHRGPACVSCHRLSSIGGLGGGTLGPDLTRVSQRLGGARGVSTWLGKPPTRVMRAVFQAQPLRDDETFAIAAMLADTPAADAPAPRWSARRIFIVCGVVEVLGALGLFAVVWSRRMTGVRRPLVDSERARAGDER